MGSLEYVEAVLKKEELMDEARSYYLDPTEDTKDPVELLHRYSEDIGTDFPENLEEQEERFYLQGEKGLQRFREALDYIAMGALMDD
ncbi:MAG: hypothetical protein ABEJ07_03535 [Candidatus Nanohaloarchaea archaeon]